MIANITKGNSIEGAIAYNENKKVELKFTDEDGVDIQHEQPGFKRILVQNFANLAGINDHKQELLQGFRKHISKNPGLMETVFNVSISFHPDEQITDEIMQNIGLDYMEQMGYNEIPMVIYRHYDRPHPHMHIVSSTIGNDVKMVKNSFEKFKSQQISRVLEKKYSLIQVVAGESLQTENTKQSLKFKVIESVQKAMSEYKVKNFEGLINCLHADGVGAEIINTNKQGKVLDSPGIIFFHLTDTFQRTNRNISGKNIRKGFCKEIFENLELNQKLNSTEITKQPFSSFSKIESDIKTRVKNLLSDFGHVTKINLTELDQLLAKNGFSYKLYSNSGGAYGWKIIDNMDSKEYKPSDLNKELSFNLICLKITGVKIREDILNNSMNKLEPKVKFRMKM